MKFDDGDAICAAALAIVKAAAVPPANLDIVLSLVSTALQGRWRWPSLISNAWGAYETLYLSRFADLPPDRDVDRRSWNGSRTASRRSHGW